MPYLKRPGVYRLVACHKGRRVDKLFEGTKQAAILEEAKLKLEFAAANPRLAALQSFKSFCLGQYADAAKNELKASTWAKRKSVLKMLIRSSLGQFPLSEAGTPASVEAYKAQRLKDGLAKVSINNELRVLRRVLRWAHELGAIREAPRIRFMKLPPCRKTSAWSREEVQKLLSTVARVSPDIFHIVLFLATTGARRGEVLALPWDNVDVPKRIIKIWTVPADEEDDSKEQWSPKTREREVPMPDALLSYFAGPRVSSKWVFPSPQTCDRFAFWPSRQFDRARDAAGLKGGAHKLRHTFASHFLERNPDPFLLARVMGHTHVSVTELYSHLVPGYLEKARNVVRFDLPAAVSAKDAKTAGAGNFAQDFAQRGRETEAKGKEAE